MDPMQKLEMEMVTDQLIKALPTLMGAYPVISQATKAYFDELKKVGFTQEQALHIVSTQGIMAGIDPNNGGEQ